VLVAEVVVVLVVVVVFVAVVLVVKVVVVFVVVLVLELARIGQIFQPARKSAASEVQCKMPPPKPAGGPTIPWYWTLFNVRMSLSGSVSKASVAYFDRM
jgi:hypothetical protein